MRVRIAYVSAVGALLCLSMSGLRAEDSVSDRAALQAGNVLTDAGQFVKDTDQQNTDSDQVANDRAAMALDLNNASNLKTDVTNFFKDRSDVAIDRLSVAFDRRQLRVDVKPHTGGINKPGPRPKDLNAAVTQFFTDFDARAAAEDAIDADYKALKKSVNQLDATAVTSNANQFFHDRHNFFQNRANEAADVFAIKKILKFKGARAALTKPPKDAPLSTYVQNFLNDRATWLADADAIKAARNNMRSALGTSSLQDTVLTWLNARHTHFIAGLQLGVDRFAMKKAAGLVKVKDVGGPSKKADITGKKDGGEDVETEPDNNLEESNENNGEK